MQLGVGDHFAGYTVVRLLGSGGMGEVYLAQHPRLPRQDALKILPANISADTSFRERFHREADLAAALWHPHIVGVHDRGEDEGQLWISMDLVDGTDAAEALATKYLNCMPASEVAAIVSAVASALDYAHKRGLLHRDVKPANIMLVRGEDDDADGRVLLADFGIARPIDDLGGLTTTNMTVGTVAYAAPEQLMGEQLDGRADQYALAATAYHLLTGNQLFPHTNPAVVISRHLNSDPPSIADTRPYLEALDPVMEAALSKNPADRFERCVDFARAFAEQVQEHGAPGTAAPTTPAPAGRRPQSKSMAKSSATSAPTTRSAPAQRIPRGKAAAGPIAGSPSEPARAQTGRSISVRLIPAAATTLSIIAVAVLLIWYPWARDPEPMTASTPTITSTTVSRGELPVPTVAAPPSPPSTTTPVPNGQAVDPAATGPSEGSSCTHAQFNNTTVANSGSIVRCISVPGGFAWEPDAGEQADPRLVGQQGWDACLRSSPQDQCVRAAVAVAGGIYPAGPVYPPGTYAVPGAMPYGTYGASIDYGTGQFSNGTAANPCTYSSYDAAGNAIDTETYSSYSQAAPQVQIDRRTASFRTSGCTPWALTKY
jgi:serine/threonine protein kinase